MGTSSIGWAKQGGEDSESSLYIINVSQAKGEVFLSWTKLVLLLILGLEALDNLLTFLYFYRPLARPGKRPSRELRRSLSSSAEPNSIKSNFIS